VIIKWIDVTKKKVVRTWMQLFKTKEELIAENDRLFVLLAKFYGPYSRTLKDMYIFEGILKKTVKELTQVRNRNNIHADNVEVSIQKEKLRIEAEGLIPEELKILRRVDSSD